MMSKTMYAGAGVALFACSMLARAASVDGGIAFDPQNLAQHTGNYPAAAVSRSDANAVHLLGTDMRTVGGNQPTNFPTVWAEVQSQAAGTLSAATGMASAGLTTATAAWSDTIRNQAQGRRDYEMNLNLSGIIFSMNRQSQRADNDFRLGYAADVLVNGVLVWHSAQTLKLAGSASSVSKEGFDVGDGSYYFSPSGDNFDFVLPDYRGSVSLGSVAAGQALNVSYRLTTFNYWDDPQGCSSDCTTTYTRIGDAFGGAVGRIAVTAVPEPDTYAMLLGGLGLVGFAARRRKAGATPAGAK